MKVGTLNITEKLDLATAQTLVDSILLDIAKKELGKEEKDLVVRDADPVKDFGLPTSEYKFTSKKANDYDTFINTTIADNRFIGIYGIGRGTDNFTLVKIISGPKELDIWDSSQAELNTEMKIKAAKTPIIITQNMPLKIDIYATAAVEIRPLIYARVCEPKGKVISGY